MMHKVYISASTQSANIGVGNYGTEQDRMQQLADMVLYWLKTQRDKFTVFRNKSGWTLEQTKYDCDNLKCEIIIDNHSNAGRKENIAGDGGAEGTEVYFHEGSTKGKKLAEIIYKYISPVSPGKDRGIKSDKVLYPNGLYILRETKPPACLIEHFFHTNLAEVDNFLVNLDKYAKAEAQAICEYFGEEWVDPVETLVKEMVKCGIVTEKKYWIKVLMGKAPFNPEYGQIAFQRAVNKIITK